MILHLINYNAQLNPSIKLVKVIWRPPHGRGDTTVRLVSPDPGAPELLTATVEAAGMSFTIPEIHTYLMAVLNY